MVGIQKNTELSDILLHVKDLFRNVTNSRTIIVLCLWNISRIFYPKTNGIRGTDGLQSFSLWIL